MGLKRFFRRGWEISGSESELIHETMYLYQLCFPYIIGDCEWVWDGEVFRLDAVGQFVEGLNVEYFGQDQRCKYLFSFVNVKQLAFRIVWFNSLSGGFIGGSRIWVCKFFYCDKKCAYEVLV